MSVHRKIAPPEGHGEVLCDPPYPTWHEHLTANRAAVGTWPAALRERRTAAREEFLALAQTYTRALGIDAPEPAPDAPIVLTGHQPELYHPGVWVKVFLLQRLAEDAGATAVDLVVDTDRAGAVGARLPWLGAPVEVRTVVLAEPGDATFAQSPVPDDAQRADFRERGAEVLERLPAPALSHHFGAYCDALDAAASRADDLGGMLTAARRAFEAPAGSWYLQAPVSSVAKLAAYRAWALDVLADAARFREVMNDALRSYRARTGTRSAAQPFPDLEQRGDRVEVPFWLLRDGTRERVWVDAHGALYLGEGAAPDPAGTTVRDLGSRAGDAVLAPKAITLTLFARLFLGDYFIHGTGGGRYDRVTDAVIRAYYGIEPPRFAVASMTLLLPLGAHVVTDEEVAALTQRLNRLEHNPDAMLDELEFDDDAEYARAHELADRKARLVREIAGPDADKKSIGAEIREVNGALVALLEPVVRETRAALERARAAQAASDVLTDRTYPFCLWDPREVADKVR